MKLVLLHTLSLFENVNFITVFAYITYILKRGLYENVKKKLLKKNLTVSNTFLKIKNFCYLVFTFRRIFEI